MKRFFPYILISVVILTAVFGPLAAHLAHGWDWFGVKNIASGAIKGVFAWIGYLILSLVSLILALTGSLLDMSITYSIINFADTSKAIVETGWTICRDIANLFFIFVLLYIAIATILQLSGYGMKELLVRVIIIALLVNFSLMITKVIIDGSNILALEFYSKITNVIDEDTGKMIKMGPSVILTSAFKPQSLFNVTETTGCLERDEKGVCIKEDENPSVYKSGDTEGEETLVNIFIITTMGSIFFLVLAFVFFAAAVLFILRTVILWILMILAPLAFLAMALPATKGYASQWWKKLFDQAFFAPVYLFLLYLVISIVSSGAIGLDVENATLSAAFMSPASNINLILKFVTMIILSLAALIIAKQMGAMGASTVMGWGNKMKGAAQGYAGKIGKRYMGRAAAGIEKGLEGEGGVAKTLRAIPFLQRGLAGVAQLKKKEEGAFEKQYGSYDTKTLQQLRGKIGTPREAQAAIDKIIKKREKKEKEDKILEEGTSMEKVTVLAGRAKEDREETEKLKKETEKLKTEKTEKTKKPETKGEEKT